MKLLTTDLTVKEIEFYKFAIEASFECGHVTIYDIQEDTDCKLTKNQIKGYVGALTKKGYIRPDCDLHGMFYVYVKFDTVEKWVPTFYGENLEEDQFDVINAFIA